MSPNELDQDLYLLGRTNAAASSIYAAKRRGKLVQVASKTFVRADMPPDEVRDLLRRHAVRIAFHLYPDRCALAGSSAVHRAPVDDVLFLASPWSRAPLVVGDAFTIHFSRTNIAQNINDEVVKLAVEDEMGEFTVNALGDVMLLLKDAQPSVARPKSTFLSHEDRHHVISRALRVHGSIERLHGMIDALAKVHNLEAYAPQAKTVVGGTEVKGIRPKPLRAYNIFWHEAQLATLEHDGHVWSFDYMPGIASPLTNSETLPAKQVPSFLGSILPETGHHSGPSMDDNIGDFDHWSRFISNITVLPKELGSGKLPTSDVMQGKLQQFMDERLCFTGSMGSSLRMVAGDDALVQELTEKVDLPRISGQQVKIATCLSKDGSLEPAEDRPFTHILKIASSVGPTSTLGVMEWYCMAIAKMCGMHTEEFALVDMGDGPPAMLAERFDIRKSTADSRMILSEDFWSIAGLRKNNHKYLGELLDVADSLSQHSTDLGKDGPNLFMQSVYSWLISNGDMHLKNLSVLRTAPDSRSPIDTVRLTPMYDMLCTKVYPKAHTSAAIGLAGNRVHSLEGFQALGRKLGMSEEDISVRISYLCVAVQVWAGRIAEQVPDVVKRFPLAMKHIETARAEFAKRCTYLDAELKHRKDVAEGKATDDLVTFAASSIVIPVLPSDVEETPELVASVAHRTELRSPAPR